MDSFELKALRGRQWHGIANDAATEEWLFSFGDNVVLQVASPWRIIADGAIRLGWRDHGQTFGLPAPVDAVREATRLLRNSEVRSATVAAETADLVIAFGLDCRLEIFNDSAGYEGCILNTPGVSWVAQGSGRLVRVSPDPESPDLDF